MSSSAIALSLVLLASTLWGQDPPAEGEKAGAAKPGTPLLAPPKIAAAEPEEGGPLPDFSKTGKKAEASHQGVTCSVEGGAITVTSTTGTLTFEYAGMGWGKPVTPFAKAETAASGKLCWTPRGVGRVERVHSRKSGFESRLTIDSKGGDGDLTLSGTITTSLIAERTYRAEEDLEEFTLRGDLVLLNSAKQRVLRVSRTIVVDAKGLKIVAPVTYTKTSTGYTFRTVVEDAFLKKATYPIVIDPVIGGAGYSGLDSGEDECPFGVAYGGGQYLVVGVTEDGTYYDVRGQFVDADGSLIGSPFTIESYVGASASPRAAYVTDDGGVFGVSYRSGNQLWLALYDDEATLIDKVRIDSDTDAANVGYHSIASNGVDAFLLTWDGAPVSGARQIWGDIRDAAGDVVENDTVLASASGGTSLHYPNAIWDSVLDQWFIAYHSDTSGDSSVKATAWNEDLSTNEISPFAIVTASSDDHQYPLVLWNSEDSEYLVVWTRAFGSPTVEGRAHARRVDASDGTLLGSQLTIEDHGDSSFATGGGYSAVSNRYVILFEMGVPLTSSGIYGQVILNDGTLWQERFLVDDDSGVLETAGCLGLNPDDDQFLAAWRNFDSYYTTYDTWIVRLEITPPPVPEGIDATVDDGMVNLTWTELTTSDLAGYHVYYRESSATEWIKFTTFPIGPPYHTVNVLTNGVEYDFCISSVDTHGNESFQSEFESFTPRDYSAPSAPTGLSADPGNRFVALTWAASAEGDLAGYRVYRSDAEWGTYALLNTEDLVTAPEYEDDGLTNGTSYWYKVTAVDTSSNEGGATSPVLAIPSYPKPGGLAFDSSTYTSITFHWTAVSESDLAGYKVYRSTTSGSGYALVSGSLLEVASFTDTGMAGTFFYVVTAVSETSEESNFSSELEAHTTTVPLPSLAPGNARKTNDVTPLVWGESEPEFLIDIYDGSTLVGSGVADSEGEFSFHLTESLWEGVHVLQAVARVDVEGDPTSSPSGGVTVVIDVTPPATPTELTLVAGTGWVDVRWDPNLELDLYGYDIYRHVVGSESSWVKLNDKPLKNNRYVDKSVTDSVHYEYRVRAVDDTLDEAGTE